MPGHWLAHIDNIASFRDGQLLFDIECHVARKPLSNGKFAYSKPKYAFMIDHCGATEKTFFGSKPLAARTFHLAVRTLPGYRLEKETHVTIRYSHPKKNHFCAWEDCVSFGTDKAGTMVGLVQKTPLDSLNELLKTLPEAIMDWNALAKKLDLRPVNGSLLNRLTKRAMEANRAYRDIQGTAKWPKNAWRFWFEQE